MKRGSRGSLSLVPSRSGYIVRYCLVAVMT